ncbi:MAG: M48 family metalloprotease [Thermosulfidibacteraceae bacterium]
MKYLKHLVLYRICAVLVSCFTFLSCTVNPASGRLQLSFVGTDTELRIGREVFQYMDRETIESGPFIKSGYAVDYVRKIVDRMYPYFHRKGVVSLEVVISPSAEPNAWALPGYVNVNIGLIPCLENEAQLAFVIGHEMGHVAARHTAERYSQTILANIAITGASIYAGRLGELIGNVGSLLVLSAYSRSQEREADKLGFYYATSAGYDANEVVKSLISVEACGKHYLSYLGVKDTNLGGFLNRLFSDHPLTEERVRNLKSMAISVRGKGAENFEHFAALKEWASKRMDLLLKIHKALYVASSRKDPTESLRILRDAEVRLKESDLEPEIKAKFYAVKAYLLFNRSDYIEAMNSAKLATSYKRDFVVAYKIGGIAGLRSKRGEYLLDSKNLFTECLNYSSNDQICLKGALISSCLLKDRDCSMYCRKYFSNYSSDFPSVSMYCIFR